jgi:Fe-S-cluster formation regulator IscX/YfhJ
MQKYNSDYLQTISINDKVSNLVKFDDAFNYSNETILKLELLLMSNEFSDIFVDINKKNIKNFQAQVLYFLIKIFFFSGIINSPSYH